MRSGPRDAGALDLRAQDTNRSLPQVFLERPTNQGTTNCDERATTSSY